MKKIFAIALALAMVLAMGTTAFAADATLTDEAGKDSATADIKAATIDVENVFVISVDVTFGAMEFTYVAGEGTWDPATHTYSVADGAGWKADGNTVTVTNHSNTAVFVTVAAELDATVANITAEVDVTDPVEIATAVDTEVEAAPAAEWELTLSSDTAEPEGLTTELAKIGTVTVSIGMNG